MALTNETYTLHRFLCSYYTSELIKKVNLRENRICQNIVRVRYIEKEKESFENGKRREREKEDKRRRIDRTVGRYKKQIMVQQMQYLKCCE